MSRLTIKHIITASGLLIFAAAMCGFAVYEISDKGNLLREQVAVLVAEQAQENSYYRLQRVFEDTKDTRAHLDTYFLKQSSESINFLNQVETIAPQAGVELKTENLEEFTDKKSGAKWIDVKFSFSGTQENVERFVRILERLPYFSQITSMSLKSRDVDDWQANITMRIFLSP
jgi:hypothetical protein